MTIARAVKVVCPTCHAPAQTPCRSPFKGAPTPKAGKVHAGRAMVYMAGSRLNEELKRNGR